MNVLFKLIVATLYKMFGKSSPFSNKNYGYNWSKQKRKCLERDSYKCRICNASEEDIGRKPSVHHIKPRSEFNHSDWDRINDLSNLVSLCPSCHGKFEGKYTDSDPAEFCRKAKNEK